MGQNFVTNRCTVCGSANLESLSICAACEEAFKSGDKGLPNTVLDLNRYTPKMFPWEPTVITPRLLTGPRSWSIFCFGLVLIVILLSLLRTPLPTCWEISS